MWSHLLIGLLKQSSVGLLLVKTICLFVFLFICSFLFFILFFYFLYIYRKQTLPSYLHSESKQCLLYIYPIYLYLQIMGWTNKTLVWYWVSCGWLPNSLQPNTVYKRKVKICWFLTIQLQLLLTIQLQCLVFDISSGFLFSKLFLGSLQIPIFHLNIDSIFLS